MNAIDNRAQVLAEILEREARVNVTWAGQNGDLPDPVSFDATDGDVKQWLTEAIRTGGVPGIVADRLVDLRDFVVDRFEATGARPYRLIQVRPKTPFGGK
jgi:hypothetical protein